MPERAKRRRFAASYKLAILEELDRATEPGAKGAILRREGEREIEHPAAIPPSA